MRRIAVNLICSLLTFTCGLAANALWKPNKYQVRAEESKVEQLPTNNDDFSAHTNISSPPVTRDGEAVFGEGRLRIVTEEVHMKSERLQYRIDVRYPQIAGSEDLYIRKLNRRIKELATERYQWPLNPSKTELRYYRDKWPEVFNSVDLDYEIRLATDSFLSIYFVAYSYGIGAAHSVESSFVVNYDLVSRKELKLSDIFKHHSKSLGFISRYCRDELSKTSIYMSEEALTPETENFESWNVTRDGIIFNFDACKVSGCAWGKQEVQIPLADLKPWLSPDSSINVSNSSKS